MLTDGAIYDTPINTIHPYKNNPRIGNIQAIKQSLQHHGQYKPIIVNRNTNEILTGNHTWQAAKELQWETIKVTYLDGLTEEQATAIVLADNRTSDLGGYNQQTLYTLLASLTELEGTGYSGTDLADLLKNLTPETPTTLTDPDETPPLPYTPITQPGDIWHLGPHTLICGSATNQNDYDKILPNGSQADMVLTDPPYNVAIIGGTKDKLTIQNDSMSNIAFTEFLQQSYNCMYAHTKPGGSIYVFHSETAAVPFRQELANSGYMFKQVLIWVKNSLVLSRQPYHWRHEPIAYGWKPGAAHTWQTDRTSDTIQQTDEDGTPDFNKMHKNDLVAYLQNLYNESTILYEDRPKRSAEHPTMKPVKLIQKLILNSSGNQQKILDPFAGSGTTLIACHQTGRIAALIELDPKYCDVIARRYQEHTGVTPTRPDGTPINFIPLNDQ
jgi:site-specific DNA-methyltransferase (adenine-specific)